MRRSVLAWLAVVAALCAGGTGTVAHEPDGRTALRYEWVKPARGGPSTTLRVLVSAIVPLREARVLAVVPEGVELRLRAIVRAGAPKRSEPSPWPVEGAAIGDLRAGDSVVLELDVDAPVAHGGVLSLSVEAISDGRSVREGIGVVVGTPGTEPAMRHGAAEFPARSDRGQP